MNTTDASEWLGLQPTHNPMRWYLPVTPKVSVRSAFLFGGAGLAAAAGALEGTTGRPVVWATAQYLSYAKVGSVMDLDVTVSVSGRRTSQARVIGHVGENEIITVLAALGHRDLELSEEWPVMPAVKPPEECKVRDHHYDAESLGQYLDQRWAVAPLESHQGGPTGHGHGNVCVWARAPEGVGPSASTLAILGDWVPMGISTVTSRPISSNSLDNTLRILNVLPTDWYLLEIESAGINNGFGHGHLRIWGDDGTLHAIASQSVLARPRDPDSHRMPRRLQDDG